MAVPPMPTAYDAWNKVLAAEFFSNAHADTPVILWVDRDTAEELQKQHKLEAPLSDAVRDALDMASRSKAFSRIKSWCERSHRPGGPPPSLPLLAASVVAASMMASDGKIRVSNFYVPFVKYLFGDSFSEEQHRVLVQSSDQLAELWVQLEQWLASQHGQFGISTIKGHETLTRIGYPISQAVLKAADRRVLSQFFRDSGLHPGKSISSDYLERALAIWLRRHPKALSPAFVAAYGHPDLQAFVNDLVLGCARVWDGVVRDAVSGQRAVRLRVRLRKDRRNISIGWAAEAVGGIDGGTIIDRDGQEHSFGLDHGFFYEGLEAVSFQPSYLAAGVTLNGITATGEKIAFVYQPSESVYFRQDRDLGWVSQGKATAFDEHMILVLDQTVPQMISELKEAGIAQPKNVKAAFAPGWSLFIGVVLREESKLIRAIGKRGSVLNAIGVQGVSKPKLVGGLQLKQKLARNLYLTGGSPDLLVDMRAHTERLVRLDFGSGRYEDVLTGGFPIPLTQEAAWESGRHSLTVDGTPLSYELVDVLADGEAPGTGTVAFAVGEQVQNRAQKVEPNAPAIRGALLPEAAEELPLTVLAFKNSSDRYLVSYDGRGYEPGAPELPVLYEKLGLGDDAFYYTDVVPPAGWSGWMIEWRRTCPRVTPVAPRRPDRSAVLSSPNREEWALAILDARSCSQNPMWGEYVTLAEEICQ
ncbi:hypothetical protein SAMN05443665_105640 [Actinomadura meyerae]|uniref:Uncharacterized protein n=1 Tax=Actinomadura meyerae TaxID=240840 RepID=A0A239NZP5_9ACTN|nr:hypothetical protein [Actinomadura meyerae]SNT60296.1 hypothetical protein SAMN05443665_105640 [Actinomadura meyerae]